MGNKGNLTFIQANEWIKWKYLPDIGKKIAFKPSKYYEDYLIQILIIWKYYKD